MSTKVFDDFEPYDHGRTTSRCPETGVAFASEADYYNEHATTIVLDYSGNTIYDQKKKKRSHRQI